MSVVAASRLQTGFPRSPSSNRVENSVRVSLAAASASGVAGAGAGVNGGKKVVKIVVVADILCMWSYVALREINQTIRDLVQRWRQAGRGVIPQFDIEFRPFFLFSELSEDEPVDREEFYEKRWGKERMVKFNELVAKRGLELGIHLGKMRQSTRAHRLVYLSYQRGGSVLQQKILEELYQSCWVRGLDVGSIPLLASIASRVGLMPYETAVMWLESGAGEAEVKRLAAISNECGIGGCPFTVIEGKWAILGGEYKEVLEQTLERITKNEGL